MRCLIHRDSDVYMWPLYHRTGITENDSSQLVHSAHHTRHDQRAHQVRCELLLIKIQKEGMLLKELYAGEARSRGAARLPQSAEVTLSHESCCAISHPPCSSGDKIPSVRGWGER